MDVTIVQQSPILTSTTGTPRTGVITMDTTPAAGNAILVWLIQISAGTRTYDVTSNHDSGYGSDIISPNTTSRVAAFLKRNIAGGASYQITLTANTGTINFVAQAIEIAGLHNTDALVTDFNLDPADSADHYSAPSGSIDVPGGGFMLAFGGLNTTSGVTATVADSAAGWAKTTPAPTDVRMLAEYKIITAALNDERGHWTNTGTPRTGTSAILWIPEAPAPLPDFIRPRTARIRLNSGF